VTSCDASGQSRLTNEFEVLRWIGKGGFGDVIKVRNKLDAGLYAIKRIPLNPRSKQFKKKITREVKLLSRLNHENVVRYYNSWIETCLEDFEPSTTDASGYSGEGVDDADRRMTSPLVKKMGRLAELKGDGGNENSLGLEDNIESQAPPPAEECDSWSFADDGNLMSPDDDDDMDVFGFSFGLSSGR
jgi:hypothetical protein